MDYTYIPKGTYKYSGDANAFMASRNADIYSSVNDLKNSICNHIWDSSNGTRQISRFAKISLIAHNEFQHYENGIGYKPLDLHIIYFDSYNKDLSSVLPLVHVAINRQDKQIINILQTDEDSAVISDFSLVSNGFQIGSLKFERE